MRSREAMDQDYRFIRNALERERTMRDRVLPEPKRTRGMKEMDDCLAALARLGQDVGAKLEEEAKQMPLIDTGAGLWR